MWLRKIWLYQYQPVPSMRFRFARTSCLNWRDEAISAAGQGLDEAWAIGVVT
jgi:hypothetical protein